MTSQRRHPDATPLSSAVWDGTQVRPRIASCRGRNLPEEAREYLEAIRPHARRDLWQLFPDREDIDRPPEQLLIPRGRAVGYLLTRNAHGLGVFVALSDFDTPRRLIDNVTSVHHLWVDLDGAPLPASWPLRPHALVNTSEGKFQAIWRVDGVPQDREVHNRVMAALARIYGADEGALGINRVLRAPGFHHQKLEPRLVRLVKASDHRAWRMAEVKDAWPTVATALATPPRQHRAASVDGVTDEDARDELQRQADRAATAPEGSRNTTLTSAAFIAGLLVGRGLVDEDTAIAVMTDAALAAGLAAGEATSTTKRQVAAGVLEARS